MINTKTSDRTIIHETYRTWQRGREAIMVYVPQYQLYQRDCLLECRAETVQSAGTLLI